MSAKAHEMPMKLKREMRKMSGKKVMCCTRVSSLTPPHISLRARGETGSSDFHRGTSLSDCSQMGK